MRLSSSQSNFQIDQKVTLNIVGEFEMVAEVNLTDSVFSIIDLINKNVYANNRNICNEYQCDLSSCFTNGEYSMIFNGKELSPAFSLAFYGVSNGSVITIIKKSSLLLNNSLVQTQGCRSTNNFRVNRELDNVRRKAYRGSCSLNSALQTNERVKRFFDEKCLGKVKDPEIVLQRFQDAINPATATESARLTDIYRCRIETNSRSFRKLCSKYTRFEEMAASRTPPPGIPLPPTILPEKPELPSTSFLPDISVISSSTNNPNQSSC